MKMFGTIWKNATVISRKWSHDTRAFVGSRVNRDGKRAFEWGLVYWQRPNFVKNLPERGTEIYSMHARGWKIAINPYENHYVALKCNLYLSFMVAFFYTYAYITAMRYQWTFYIHAYIIQVCDHIDDIFT